MFFSVQSNLGMTSFWYLLSLTVAAFSYNIIVKNRIHNAFITQDKVFVALFLD